MQVELWIARERGIWIRYRVHRPLPMLPKPGSSRSSPTPSADSIIITAARHRQPSITLSVSSSHLSKSWMERPTSRLYSDLGVSGALDGFKSGSLLGTSLNLPLKELWSRETTDLHEVSV